MAISLAWWPEHPDLRPWRGSDYWLPAPLCFDVPGGELARTGVASASETWSRTRRAGEHHGPRARGWLVFGGVLGLGAVLRLCRAWPRRHLGRQDHQWAGNAAGEDFMVAGGARLRIREAPTGDAGVLADMDAYVRQSHPTLCPTGAPLRPCRAGPVLRGRGRARQPSERDRGGVRLPARPSGGGVRERPYNPLPPKFGCSTCNRLG